MSIKYANADILSVSTVSDLFSLKSIKDNQLVQTQGYSTEGVGTNLYRYDGAGAATIDGGFVLPGVGGTLSFSGTTFNGTEGTGRFVAIDQTVADVTKFGALGDGVADDSSPYLRVLQSATDNDVAAVFIGDFKLSSLPSTGFQASGKLSIVADGAIFTGPSTAVGNVAITISGSPNITIDGGTFRTFYVPILANGGITGGSVVIRNTTMTDCQLGVSATSADAPVYVSITECTVTNYQHKGIAWLGSSVADVVISGNVIGDASGTNVQTGIQIGDNGIITSKSIVVENNTIRNHVRTSLGTVIGLVTYGYHSIIKGNSLNNVYCAVSGNSDAEAGIYTKSRGGTIVGNTLYDAGRKNGCIVWKGGDSGCVIANNIITMRTSTYNPFIGIRAYMKNAQVIGNVIDGSGASVDTGILLGDTHENIAVKNNVITNCVYATNTSRAIACPGSSGIDISSNVIQGCGTTNPGSLAYGIDFNSPTGSDNDITISNNTISSPVISTYSVGIHLTGNATQSLSVNGNKIVGYTSGINADDSGSSFSGVSICGNIIDGQNSGVTGGTSFGIAVRGVSNASVSKNVIANLSGGAADICVGINARSDSAGGLANVSIADNELKSLTSTNAFYGTAVNVYASVAAGLTNFSVTGNVATNVRRGFLLQNTATDTGITIFTNNVLTGLTGGGADDDFYCSVPTVAQISGNLHNGSYDEINKTEVPSRGTGSPEGVVAAPIGSLYTRTDGGAGTTLYVKESGTGNTGWVAK